MKKLKIWSMMMLMVMALPLVIACGGSDDDGDTINVSDFVGDWYCIQSTDYSNGNTYSNLFKGVSVTINANGTYTSTSSSFGKSGTYSLSGNTIHVVTNTGRSFTIRVSLIGDRMTWNGSGEGVTFTYVFNREDTIALVDKSPFGSWTCTQSTDTSNGVTYVNLFVGVVVTINTNYTYSSTSSSFGTSGTFTINANKIRAVSNTGRIFNLTYVITSEGMTWNGTTDEGVEFTYNFRRN